MTLRPRAAGEAWQFRIAVGMSAAVLLAVVLVNALLLRGLNHDFTNMYAAGRIVSQGQGARLYDLQVQTQTEEQLYHWGGLFVFLHPPFEAWFLAPLARLPYTAAYTFWGAINIALWVGFVYLLRPYVLAPRHPLQYLLLCFVFFPVWVALMQGQTSILLLVLLALVFVALKRRRDAWAGVFLGLGLFKFPLVLPLAVIFLLKAKWKLIAGFAAAAGALAALSLAAVGKAGMFGYVHLLADTMKHRASSPYLIEVSLMPNLRGFFQVVSSPVLSAGAINGVVVVASVCLIGYVAWRWRELPGQDGAVFDPMFAAALAISQVTAFYVLIHDLSPTLLAALLMMGSGRYVRGSARWAARAAAIAAVYALPILLMASRAKPVYVLAPVLILLAWVAMAGAESSTGDACTYADVD